MSHLFNPSDSVAMIRFEEVFSPKKRDIDFTDSLVEPFKAINDPFQNSMFGQSFDLPWNVPAPSNLSRGK
jgi:hypothetical protein